MNEGDIIFTDTGCTLAWLLQTFETKKEQRLFHDFNNTAMGYALPGSIGASIARNRQPIICVTGDGSMQMNIQELATIIHYNLPIKIQRCNKCNLVTIRPTPTSKFVNKFYSSRMYRGLYMGVLKPPKLYLNEAFNRAKKHVSFISKFIKRKNISILDFGCSDGVFLVEFKRKYNVLLDDCIIAATVFIQNSKLWTKNLEDFQKIKEIVVEKPY